MKTDILSLLPTSRLAQLPSTQIQVSIPSVLFSHQKQCKLKWHIMCEEKYPLILQYQWEMQKNSESNSGMTSKKQNLDEKNGVTWQSVDLGQNAEQKTSQTSVDGSAQDQVLDPSIKNVKNTRIRHNSATANVRNNEWSNISTSTSSRERSSSAKEFNAPMSPIFQLDVNSSTENKPTQSMLTSIPKSFDNSTIYEYMYLEEEMWNSIQINPPNFKDECDLAVPKGILEDHAVTLLVRIGISKTNLLKGELRSVPMFLHRDDFLGTPYEWSQFSNDERECIILHQEAKKINVDHALATRCISTKSINDQTFVQVEIENLTTLHTIQLHDVSLHLYDSKCLKAVTMEEIAGIIVSQNQISPSMDQFSLSTEDVGNLFEAIGPTNLSSTSLAPGEKYCAFFRITPIHSYHTSEKKFGIQNVHGTPKTKKGNSSQSSSRSESRRSTFLAFSKLGSTIKKGLFNIPINTSKRNSMDYEHHRTLSASPTLQKAFSKTIPPRNITNTFEFESKVYIKYDIISQGANDEFSFIECDSIYYLQWIALLPRGLILRVRLPDEIYALTPFLVDIWVYNCTGHPTEFIFSVPTDFESKFLCSDTQSHLGLIESNEGRYVQIQFTAIEKGIQDLNLMYLVDKVSKEEFLFPTSIYVNVK